ncbi:hypothetical protein ACUH7Y_05250 [Clostridium beijerinckii]|uniref:Uncharacterized protein n=1 Tax=Clostridium beijerinckii TaxID=1520 RepID=A0A7X9XP53_CLOBE|nr:hypothetical protein [Clostridium beijerinckii]NMF04805.1 hypothetical protein [Clostridium beijerinckii]
MNIARRNKDYAVVPVSKEIMMDDSKITSCTQDASPKGVLLTSILGTTYNLRIKTIKFLTKHFTKA